MSPSGHARESTPALQGGPTRSLREWYGRWRPEVLLALVVVLLTAPIVQPRADQQESRLALTAAIWDDGTVRLDRYEPVLGVDRAVRNGHLYSDKAPGQPILAIPAYAAYRALGGEPAIRTGETENVALWTSSLLTSVLPAVLLVVMMRRLALRIAPERATAAALAMSAGTLLLPFGTQLFGHVLAAALVFGAYLLLVSDDRAGPRQLAAAGLLAGVAVAVEYPTALLALVLAIVASVRHDRGLFWFTAGALCPAPLLAAYHWAAFGGPLDLGYDHSQFEVHESGVRGVQAPSVARLGEVLFGERGLFLLTPLVLLAVVGAVILVRERGRGAAGRGPSWQGAAPRFHAIVALAMVGSLLLVQAGWSNAWGGASPGPRYVVPALPFLVVGVARIWQWWSRFTVAAVAFSIATMMLATFTWPLVSRHDPSALETWISFLLDGHTATSVLTTHWGGWALALPLLGALAVAARVAVVTGPRTGTEAAAP